MASQRHKRENTAPTELDAALKAAQNVLPSPAEWERYAVDRQWIQNNWDTLVAEHPESWIAVHNKKVIASDRLLDDLVNKLNESDIKANEAALEFVTARKMTMIL